MNQCIHNADLMYWMLGDIDEVFAYTAQQQHDYLEAEDLGLALVKGKNGAYGLFEGTVNVYPKNLEETLYLFGERGTVKAAGTSVNLIEEWRFADGRDDPEAVKRDCNEQPPNIYGFGQEERPAGKTSPGGLRLHGYGRDFWGGDPVKKQITMLLTNGFDPDPRVYKEAVYLVRRGFTVTILCWDRDEGSQYPAHEVIDGIEIVRFRIVSEMGSGKKHLPAFFAYIRACRKDPYGV